MKEERNFTILVICLTAFVSLVFGILTVICFHFGIINAGVDLANMYFIIRRILGIFLIILGGLIAFSILILIVVYISAIIDFVKCNKENK